MQRLQDGKSKTEKELPPGFRIPKRKRESSREREAQVQEAQHVLEASYYNWALKQGNPAGYVPTDPLIARQAQNAVQAFDWGTILNQQKERPKTYSNHLLRETIPDCFDESLPRELVTLFQPLYCKLCSAQLSSNIVARLHYKSKNHEKKVRKFLIEHSEKTGEPLHKRAKIMGSSKGSSEAGHKNPMYFYCDLCDLPLTGKLHAESHYMGKNHRKATLGVKKPAGKGHYSIEGKWVRDKKLPGDANGDGFGTDFRAAEVAVAMPGPLIGPQVPAPTAFRCDICNVTTTCWEQMESHYKGQKHRKKVKQQSAEYMALAAQAYAQPTDPAVLNSMMYPAAVPAVAASTTFDSAAAKTSAAIAAANKSVLIDCSVYRTPSGQFYCQVCNSSITQEIQFRQHLQSKNHLKKAAVKRA